ncbi:hypothetical protein PLESTB_000784500 [Pleodorina starrii]|uniref:Uncharacterized protein n=1 Tax=Pleodorina starrii TaxID=330485 RepID=A0A9W6BKN4_9CHLO|nr:hypothetical protein PLESTM_000500400 [Pleodorina starrii]GLC53763.1 hypothetical protein PLESTB_000784500 [Pleodorina starrii]GLC72943.1 hypothetical protein PLESTF_001312100 [Pleodorina starrii]
MTADVQWQHLPFDVFRLVISSLSRMPPNSPGLVKSQLLIDEQHLSAPAGPSVSTSPDPTIVNNETIPQQPSPGVADGSQAGEPSRNDGMAMDEEAQQELFLLAVRTARLVCRSWRDAASSAVMRLQLATTDVLRPERPLAAVFPELYELDVTSYSRLHDDDVPLLSGCRKLAVLKLNGQRLTSAGIAALAPLTSLERLDLACGRLQHPLAHLLRALPGLKHATLRGCTHALLPPPPPPPPPPGGPPPPLPPAAAAQPARPHTLTVALTPAQKRFPSTRTTGTTSTAGSDGGAGGATETPPSAPLPPPPAAEVTAGGASAAATAGLSSLPSSSSQSVGMASAPLTEAAPPPSPAPQRQQPFSQATGGAAAVRQPPPPPPPPGPPPPPLFRVREGPQADAVAAAPNGARQPPPPPPPGPPPPPPPLLGVPNQRRMEPAAAAAGPSSGSGSAAGPSTAAAPPLQRPQPFAHAANEAALAPAEAAARLALALYDGASIEEHTSEGTAAPTAAASAGASAPKPNPAGPAGDAAGTSASPPQAASSASTAPHPHRPNTSASAAATPASAVTAAAASIPPCPPLPPPLVEAAAAAPVSLEWCASVPALQSLHLVDIRGPWLSGVAALRRLTELSVRDCGRPAAAGAGAELQRPMGALADGLTGLRRLALYGTSSQLDGSDVADAVSRFVRLEALTIESLAVVPHQLVLRKDLDQLLPSLAPLAPRLSSLVLRRPGWTLDRLAALAPLSGLTRLEVGDSAGAAAGRGGRLGAGGGGGGGGAGGGATGLTSDAGLRSLAGMFPRLHVFSLGPPGSDSVTEEGLAALAARVGGLAALDLQGCSRLRPERLGPVLGLMTRLRSLDLSNCLNLLDSTLPHLTALSSLTSLRLRGCWKLSGSGLGALHPPLLCLHRLDLSDCRVTDEGLQQVARLSCLTSLQLRRSWAVRAPGLAALSRLTRLAALDLGSTNTDDTGLEQLVSGLGLSVTDLNLSATLISQRGVGALAGQLPRLRRLHLSKCPGVDDAALAHLGTLSCLRRLHLTNCRNITDAAVRQLAAKLRRTVQHIELNGCWGVAMSTMDELYGRPGAEWRRAEDVARAEALSGGGWGEEGAEWEG